jgi:hypothetical protein
MPMMKSHKRFQIRLLIEPTLVDHLDLIARANLTSRLSVIRKFLNDGVREALKAIKESDQLWNSLEPTKKKLVSHVERMEKIIGQSKDPIDF